MARWDDRLGVVVEAKYPENVTQGFADDDFLTIFSTHAMSERAGFLAMRIKRLNLASYYSGIPEHEGEDQYYVAILLDPQEDANPFEERLSETARMLISMSGKPNFDKFFEESFLRLVKMKEITEEQRYAFIFQDKVRHLMLEKLASGPMTKDGLAKWLSKEVEKEVTDIDGLLAPLEKTGLIIEENISKGKKVTLEYIFLMRDIASIRVPALEIFKAAKGGQMPANLQKPYMEECEKFFKKYRLTTTDSRVIAGFIADPDKYEIIKVLRKEYLTKVELPAKLAREVTNLDVQLKELHEAEIIWAYQDKKKQTWLFLKSDIFFPSFFPDYMIDVIRRRWKEATIPKEIAIKHLELLRAAYISTENPKYKIKIVLRVELVMKQSEKLITSKNYEQGATSLDEVASLMRDMAERAAAEMTTIAAKNVREDKGKYVSEKWDEDRAKINKEIERIHKETEDMTKRKKAVKLEFKVEKKVASEKAEKLEEGKKGKKGKKGKGEETYVEPESLEDTIAEVKGAPPKEPALEEPLPEITPPKPAPPTAPKAAPAPFSAPPKASPAPSSPPSAPVKEAPAETPAAAGDMKARLKELEKQLKEAQKAKDAAAEAETWRDMATCYDALGDKKSAEKARVTQNEVTKKGLIDLRKGMLADAQKAEKAKDYKKAAEFYAQVKNISQELFKSGEMREQDNVKLFSNKQKEMENKAGD